jgi:ankyrin repeat protein
VTLLLSRGARGDLYLLETFVDPLKQKRKRKTTPMMAALSIAFWSRDLCCTIIRELVRHGGASPFSKSIFWTYLNHSYIAPPPLFAGSSVSKVSAYIDREIEKMVTLFMEILTLSSSSLDQASVKKMVTYINMYGTHPSDQSLIAEYSKRQASEVLVTPELAIIAAENGQLQVLETYIENGTDPGLLSECLPATGRSGNAAILRVLLDYFPTDDAIVGRYTRISWIEAALAGHTECLQIYLDRGFDVNAFVKHEMQTTLPGSGTALAFAVQHGILDTVIFLSKVPKTDFGITSEGNLLHLAGKAPIHRKELIQILLQMGVDPLQYSREGKSVLHSFLQNGSYAGEQDLDVIRTLILHGCDLQHVDDQGRTLLHALLDRPYLYFIPNLKEVIDLIDDQGRMRTRMDKKGSLPLHFAVRARASDDIIRTLIPDDISLLYPEVPRGLNVLHIAVMPGVTPGGPPPPGPPPTTMPRKRFPQPPQQQPFIRDGSNSDDAHVVRILSILLECDGVNVDVRDERGNTPLITFASHCTERSIPGKSLALKLLLERGADVNASNSRRWTALHYLMSQGYETGLVKLLASCPKLLMLNDNGFSPLHQAIHDGRLNSVQLWIERAKAYNQEYVNFKQSFTQPTSGGLYPLHLATQRGRSYIIILLRDMDMLDDTNKRIDPNGSTSLHLAATANDIPCIEVLLKCGADINAVDKRMRTPLHNAATAGRAAAAKLLAENGALADLKDENGKLPYMLTPSLYPNLRTALEMAAKARTSETQQVELGDNILTHTSAVRDEDPVAEMFKASLLITPQSVTIDETSLLEAVESNNSSACYSLLRTGSNPDNVLNDKQQTGLHIACESGLWIACRTLLEFHASTSARDEDGNQPLHDAVINGHPSIVKQLLESGADVFARNKKMSTPLHLAAEYGQIRMLKCLVDHVRASHIAENGNEDTPNTKMGMLDLKIPGQIPLR